MTTSPIPTCPRCGQQSWCAHSRIAVLNRIEAEEVDDDGTDYVPSIEREIDTDSEDEATSDGAWCDYAHCLGCEIDTEEHPELFTEELLQAICNALRITWCADPYQRTPIYHQEPA